MPKHTIMSGETFLQVDAIQNAREVRSGDDPDYRLPIDPCELEDLLADLRSAADVRDPLGWLANARVGAVP